MKSFIETNHRNPSKHRIEEHDMLNWVKAERREALMMLLDLWEENKHLNHL